MTTLDLSETSTGARNPDRRSALVGPALPNVPREDRPAGSSDVVWRYSQNPIIQRNAIPTSNSIFNSAVVPFDGKFAGVFRCDDKRRLMNLHAGFSDDGVHWNIAPDPIEWVCDDPEIARFVHRYDPRVCWLEDRYYVTWCNGYHGPTIGVGYTHDFKTFYQTENAFLPYNRNGVLFPRKINGKYAMVSRPSDTGHTPFGDIFYARPSPMLLPGALPSIMVARTPSPAWPLGMWMTSSTFSSRIPMFRMNDGLPFTLGVNYWPRHEGYGESLRSEYALRLLRRPITRVRHYATGHPSPLDELPGV